MKNTWETLFKRVGIFLSITKKEEKETSQLSNTNEKKFEWIVFCWETLSNDMIQYYYAMVITYSDCQKKQKWISASSTED